MDYRTYQQIRTYCCHDLRAYLDLPGYENVRKVHLALHGQIGLIKREKDLAESLHQCSDLTPRERAAAELLSVISNHWAITWQRLPEPPNGKEPAPPLEKWQADALVKQTCDAVKRYAAFLPESERAVLMEDCEAALEATSIKKGKAVSVIQTRAPLPDASTRAIVMGETYMPLVDLIQPYLKIKSHDILMSNILVTEDEIKKWEAYSDCGKPSEAKIRKDKLAELKNKLAELNEQWALLIPSEAEQAKWKAEGQVLSEKEIKERHDKEGRYTLEEAANLIEQKTSERAKDMLKKLMQAVGDEVLLVCEPRKKAPYKSKVVREFYEEAYWDDLNAWLKTNCPRVSYEFPKPDTTTGKGEAVPGTSSNGDEGLNKKPLQQQLFQEQEILRVIGELSYDPKKLPKRKQGKPGAKAEVRKMLSFSVKVFDKAWERLRANQDIQDAE